MLMPTRILVPTDFSEYSDRALEQALDIAKQYHAKVFLLHVVHDETHVSIVWILVSLKKVAADQGPSHWPGLKKDCGNSLTNFRRLKRWK